MKAPVRWTHGGGELDPEIATLLRSAPPSRPMNGREYSRTWRKIRVLVALGPAAGFLLWVKASLAALVAVLVGTAAFYGVRHHLDSANKGAASPALSGPVATAVRAESATAAVTNNENPTPGADPRAEASAPSPESTVLPSIEPRPHNTVVAQPAASKDSAEAIEQELALIERARSLSQNDPTQAQKLLREHSARFPRGALAMERELVMIEALMHAGQRAEARGKAASMLKSAKGSLYQKRLENLLQQMQ